MRNFICILILTWMLITPVVTMASTNAEFVKELYQKYLERDPDPSGIATYVGGLEHGRLTRAQVRMAIITSPEFRKLKIRKLRERKAEENADPAGPVNTVEDGGTGDAAGNRPGLDQVLEGVRGNPQALGDVPLEGYDSGKLHNPEHKTPKYLFGRVASRHSLAGVKNHADAEALLRKMLPEMKASGLIIEKVSRDKILVKTDIGWEWVDVVRGAGGGNPGWWWGSEGKSVAGGESTPATPTSPTSPTAPPLPPSPPDPSGNNAGAPLVTVPDDPEVRDAPIDTSSDDRAILSAAVWVKQKYAHLFVNEDDRGKCLQIMTKVIGALRAKGYDATRVVNHPSRPVGDPWRYGSDALVLNGRIYDVYGAMGSADCRPQVLNQGPYAAGRLRE